MLPFSRQNIIVCGDIHSGKSSLIDLFHIRSQTHSINDLMTKLNLNLNDENPYKNKTDQLTNRNIVEKERGVTLFNNPIIIPFNGTQYTFIDTPGHFEFIEQVEQSLNFGETVFFVHDITMPITQHEIELIKLIKSKSNLNIVLFLNKIDLLITSLKLDPYDAWLLIDSFVNKFNSILTRGEESKGCFHKLDPLKGEVIFGSALHLWTIDLRAFASKITDCSNFINALWGLVNVNETVLRLDHSNTPGFVEYVLEPLYKLYINSLLFEDKEKLRNFLRNFGVFINRKILDTETNLAFLRMILMTFCPFNLNVKENTDHTTTKRLIIGHRIPFSNEEKKNNDNGVYMTRTFFHIDLNEKKSYEFWRSEKEKIVVNEFIDLSDGSIIQNCVIPSGSVFGMIGEVEMDMILFSSIDDITNFEIKEKKTKLFTSRIETIEVDEKEELGNVIYILKQMFPNVDSSSFRTTTDLFLHGTGLYSLDVFFDFVQEMKINLRKSDPFVEIMETISTESQITAIFPHFSGDGEIHVSCFPIDEDLAKDISKKFKNKIDLIKKLNSKHDWKISFAVDILFQLKNSCLLINRSNVDVSPFSRSIEIAMNRVINSGPLCSQPMSRVGFIIEKIVLPTRKMKIDGQLGLMLQKCCYSAFLLSNPRILESKLQLHLILRTTNLKNVNKSLLSRRGNLGNFENIDDSYDRYLVNGSIPGTMLFSKAAYVPTIDSIGLEIELKARYFGQLMYYHKLHSWEMLNGNPLDSSIEIQPLKTHGIVELPRDLMLKFQAMKGLIMDLNKHFSDITLDLMMENNISI
eukprot:TRINITY_DN391_c0_g1_i1.p1 TRINITY_DN391_c0_g1~~TRINITY_DN391_c0_g1_i1.p1  ORF type:complete len:804 (+),score=194.08 TRINITY_DN391_c0_g1_i1:37-2448(+)